MTQTLANRWIETHAVRSATKWSQVAAVASVLALVVASPARADMGSFFGGVVGGMLNNMQQPQPQYQQPQYQQPQYQYRQPDPAAAEARRQAAARAAEAKRQKAEEQKAKKEQESANMMPPPGVIGGSGPIDVVMKRKDGNLWVPAQINKVVTIDFVIDSGASDITLPRDVYSTLIRSGTLTKANYISSPNYKVGDGSEVKGVKFKLASLQVGNQILTDVVASVMPSDAATPLLGLSFLSRFQSWSIDNNSGTLKLLPIGANPSASPSSGTQVASANSQALPELPAAPGSATPVQAAAPATPAAPTPSAFAQAPSTTAQPQPEPTGLASPAPLPVTNEPTVAAATPETPRSGHVTNSVLLVKEATPTPPAATETVPVAKADAAVPVFPANAPYGNARSSLMALGYGPVALPDAGKCDNNTDLTCFPERASCTKADGIQCEFLWKRGEQLIKVRTVAIPPTISAVECQVNCK
jgi:clan AA aspartic protease (TIGR02281 family)